MISGRKTGTSGRPPKAGDERGGALERWLAHPLILIAVVGIVVGFVNATSELIDLRRLGFDPHPAAQFFNEFSSVAVILALAPFIGVAVDRVPPRPESWPRALLIHAALTIPFAIAHVAGIWAVRVVGYGLAGAHYDFADGNLPLVFIYEYRKDVISYAVIAATYWTFRVLADRSAAKTSADPGRIEIRDGGATAYLDPAEIYWLEAAGNYVEFHTAARSRLVRGTLAAWEAKLAPLGFVRAHRSRIVNRARISTLTPTPSGDFSLTLDDGRVLSASRRYREALHAGA